MTETVREGRCGCGGVRYRATGEPIFVNNCHCRLCQRQTGSTSVVNAFFEADRIVLLDGETIEHTVRAGSGDPHTIVRCGSCGTALWSRYPRFGSLGVGLRVGTIDDATGLIPDALIFVESRMPWVALPPEIPAFETSYNPIDVLPSDRIVRLRALIARREAGEG